MRTISLIIWVALLAGTISAPVVNACTICAPDPKTTIADVLNERESIVFAREKQGKPYFFSVVEVLKGAMDGDEFKAFIYFIDRLTLSKNLKDVAVFAKKDSGDKWQYIAYANEAYQAFVKEIISQAESWKKIKGSSRRIDFFAELLTNSNPNIREQAYLEVSRAPYASIKRIAGTVPRRQIHGVLASRRLTEWHSLFILMLGQSRHPDDRAYIRNTLEYFAQHQFTRNLSAWVTAFIESQPKSGVEEVEKLYFSAKDRTKDELEEVVKGFSVLGSEGGIPFKPEILARRRRIVNSYATLLDNYPTMAGSVARDLTSWKIRAQEKRLSRIKSGEPSLDPTASFAVDYYLSAASKFPVFKGNH